MGDLRQQLQANSPQARARPSGTHWLILLAATLVVGAVWHFAFRSGDADKPAAIVAPPRCDPGDWAACDNDAQRVQASDPKAAADFYAKACAGGYGPSCTRLGAMQEHDGGALDAMKSYATACDRSELAACVRRGSLFEHGVDWRIPKDWGKAIALYKRACDGGEGRGCVALAEMREHSRDLAPDDYKITALYVKGCERKDMLSCWRLSQRYRAGRGTRKNEPKANELKARACTNGCSEACGDGVAGAVVEASR